MARWSCSTTSTVPTSTSCRPSFLPAGQTGSSSWRSTFCTSTAWTCASCRWWSDASGSSAQTADGGRIQFSEALPGTPRQIFDVVDRAGLEGVVCKRADSRYVSGKTKVWLEAKAFEEADFDLVGLRRERGKPAMAILARDGRPAGSAFHVARQHPRAVVGARPAAHHTCAEGKRDGTGEARYRLSRSLPQGRGAAAPCDAARLAGYGEE